MQPNIEDYNVNDKCVKWQKYVFLLFYSNKYGGQQEAKNKWTKPVDIHDTVYTILTNKFIIQMPMHTYEH